MSKLLHSSVFRFLVCFLLIGCILVNLSPLKAEATTVVVPTAVLTFKGLMAALYSMGIGIVATELTIEAWNKIGNSLTEAITDTGDSTITEAWFDLEAMYDSYIPGGGLDPDDELKWAEKLKHVLSRGLLGAIAGWLCTLVNMGGFEVDGDSAANGWSYYGDTPLPTLPTYDDLPYIVVVKNGTTFRVAYCDQPMYRKSDSTSYYFAKSYYYYRTLSLTQSFLDGWNINSSLSPSDKAGKSYGFQVVTGSEFIWSNHDILSYEDGVSVICVGGPEPTTTKTEIIEPSIYVGDIPQQIQDGEKDKDNLVLPIIDPFKLIQTPSTALDDVNQMQQALKDGTTTLDQYLEQVTYQEPTTDPDPTTDPSESTQPSTGTDTKWEPPENPGDFALDLSNVFPFCIPFDLYDFLTCLNADPVAPVIQWELPLPGGGSYPIEIDLSPFDPVAQLLRRLQLLLFCVALAIKTRDLIKG